MSFPVPFTEILAFSTGYSGIDVTDDLVWVVSIERVAEVCGKVI